VAYRQPVTRAEIEHIRGVDAGAVLRSLLDRQLVRIAGHREVPGRPIVYATSRRFLEVFGLAKLGDLPSLRAIEALAEAGEAEEADALDESAEEAGLAARAPVRDDEDDAEPSLAGEEELAAEEETPPPGVTTH
jgi:segregation and condensation protein B